MLQRTLLALVAAVALGGCTLPWPSVATPATATIDGVVVAQDLYDVLLASAKHQAATAGAGIDPGTDAGARHLARVQAAAMRTALHDTEVDRLAAASRITVSGPEIDAAIARVAEALGADTSLDALLGQTGMSRSAFRLVMRYRLLEQKLRGRDPRLDATLNTALARSDIRVYAPPCRDDHRYPQCLDAGAAG
jgi:hypothetical protein